MQSQGKAKEGQGKAGPMQDRTKAMLGKAMGMKGEHKAGQSQGTAKAGPR
jgi:hypothetical protein